MTQSISTEARSVFMCEDEAEWALHLTWGVECLWSQLPGDDSYEKNPQGKTDEETVFWTWYSNLKTLPGKYGSLSGYTVNINRIIKCPCYYDSDVFFSLPVFHLKCIIVRCDMCLFWICRKSCSEGCLAKKKKAGFSLWKSWQSKHFVFSSLW